MDFTAKEKEMIQKADLALSDITSDGGLLNPIQNDTFIDLVQNEPTLIKEVNLHRMNAPQEEINKIDIGSMIIKAARQSSSGSGRALTEAERTKPTTSQITLATTEIITEARIRYEVLEDNIEKGRFEQTLMRQLAAAWARDLERILIQADTAGSASAGEEVLDAFDGVLKLVTSKVVDAEGREADPVLFKVALDTLGRKYAQDRSALRFYSPFDIANDVRLKRSMRETGLGDTNVTGVGALPIFGVNLQDLAFMNSGTMLLGNPKNIILGFQRNMRIERDVDITKREHIFVATARIAIQLMDEPAFVKIENVGTMALPELDA